MSKELRVALEAAKQGAKVATKYFQTPLTVKFKENNTPVTIADAETEHIIRQTILSSSPHAHFVGEEHGGTTDKDAFWIIDPIDGTKEYIRGIQNWSILIAYYANNDIQVGVSFMPAQNELLYAQRGSGAILNDKSVHVSTTKELARAYLTLPSFRKGIVDKRIKSLAEQTHWARSIGNAMAFHFLASGRTDITIDTKLSLWDIAPFKVIVEEAGGRVSDLEGDAWNLATTDFVASNGLLHDDVIKILNQKS